LQGDHPPPPGQMTFLLGKISLTINNFLLPLGFHRKISTRQPVSTLR
jgi:hypothetical protein